MLEQDMFFNLNYEPWILMRITAQQTLTKTRNNKMVKRLSLPYRFQLVEVPYNAL